jgi:hypothetical protein
LSVEDIVQALSSEPWRPFDRGQLKAIRRRVNNGSGLTSKGQRLIDWLLRMQPAASSPTWRNPARLDRFGRPAARSLTASDIEWIRRLPVDPSKLTDEDVRTLAEIEAEVDNEPDRRLVRQVLSPARRIHDRREEEAQLREARAAAARTKAWRTPEVKKIAADLLGDFLADRLRAELEPTLRGGSPEAKAAAEHAVEAIRRDGTNKVDEVWKPILAAAAKTETQAALRLRELAVGADPVSSQPDPTGTRAGFEAGQRRFAAQHRTHEGPLDRMHDVGGQRV